MRQRRAIVLHDEGQHICGPRLAAFHVRQSCVLRVSTQGCEDKEKFVLLLLTIKAGRQQKKKCDETPGTCKACSKRRIRCIWRSDDDVSENASPSNTASFTEADETVSQSPFSSSGLSSAEDWDSASAVWEAVSSGHPSPSLVTSNAVVRANRSVTALPLTSNVQSFTALPDALLFDHARYIFVPQLIRPDVTKSFAEKYASESLQLAYNVPFFMNAVLACSGAELRADSPYHRRLAEAHYTDAVTGLRKYLGGQNRPQIEALALRTVMLLCIFEVSKYHVQPTLSFGECSRLLIQAISSAHFGRNEHSLEWRSCYDQTFMHLYSGVEQPFHCKRG